MSLRQRFTLSIFIILILFTINVVLYFWSSHQRTVAMDDQLNAISGQVHLGSVKQKIDELHKAVLVLTALHDSLPQSLNTEEVAQALSEIAALKAEIKELETFTNAQTRVHYEKLWEYFNKLAPLWKEFYLSFNNSQTIASSAVDLRESVYATVMGELLVLEDDLTAVATEARRQIDAIVRFTDRITVAVFLTSIVLALILAYVLLRNVNRSLNQLYDGAIALGAGNLNHRIPTLSNDELGQLAHAFNDMTAKLQEAVEDVRQAQIAADEANHAKSRFLANMSHELRSPLTAIIGCSDMLIEEIDEKPPDPEHQQEEIKRIRDAGRDLLRLINDLLDLSKIEAGKMDLHREKFQPTDALQNIVETLQPLAMQSDNELVLKVLQQPPLLFTDVTKFRQLFFNLLSNACKFTNHGQIIIHVEYDPNWPDKSVTFRVRDTGIGISKEQLDVIFDAFVQADSSTSREYGGTGLGLSLCKQYCDLMGGTISVDSKPGLGTEFCVVLPVGETELMFTPEKSAAATTPTATAPDRLKVLVIDDDPVARSLVSKYLKKHEHGVLEAENGQDGIEIAKAEHPDLILLDVMMPKVDGWTVLSVLKGDPMTADIPVVMQSMLNEEELGLEMGAANYLQKPVNWDELSDILDSLAPGKPRKPAVVLDDKPALRDRLVNTLNDQGWHGIPCEHRNELNQCLQHWPDALLIVCINDTHYSPVEWSQWLQEQRKQHPEIQVLIVIDDALEKSYRPELNPVGLQTITRDGFEIEKVLAATEKILSTTTQTPTEDKT